MNKKDLIRNISQKTKYTQQQIRLVVDEYLNLLKEEVIKGRTFKMNSLGSISKRKRKARKGRNPRTGESVMIPSRIIPLFRFSKSFKTSISPNRSYTIAVESVSKIKNRRKGLEENEGSYIELGQLNLGKRRSSSVSDEDMVFEYLGNCQYGGHYIEKEEYTQFPYWVIPIKGTRVLKWRSSNGVYTGASEPILFDALSRLIKVDENIQLLQNITLPIKNRNYGYKPDIVVYWPKYTLCLDIEIDEPYDLVSRKPLHYLKCSDHLRNLYFVKNGWMVLHVAEEQVVKSPYDVVRYIIESLAVILNDYSFIEKCENKLNGIERWDYSTAQKMAEENYRENYLGIKPVEEQDEANAMTISSTRNYLAEYVKPDVDILAEEELTEEEARVKNRISECLGLKYVKIQTRPDGEEMLFLSETVSFIQEKGFQGIDGYEEVLEKHIFVPFDIISKVSSQNNLYKEYKDRRNKHIYDARINQNPIHFDYVNGQGEFSTRTVVYPNEWYAHLDEWKAKYEVNVVLAIMARFNFRTLIDYNIVQDDQINYVSGWCQYREEIRTFRVDRMSNFKVFDCRKPNWNYSNDMWECLERNRADLAIAIFDLLLLDENKSFNDILNYAHAQVMINDFDKAIDLYKSHPANERMWFDGAMVSWKKLCLGDITHFIEKDIYKESFEKVRAILEDEKW